MIYLVIVALIFAFIGCVLRFIAFFKSFDFLDKNSNDMEL